MEGDGNMVVSYCIMGAVFDGELDYGIVECFTDCRGHSLAHIGWVCECVWIVPGTMED